MRNLADFADLAVTQIWDGVSARTVHGERITFAIVEIDPGAVVPEHDHDNEQLGLVLQGSVSFRIDDEERRLGPGGTWRIPGGHPHEVRAGGAGAVVVDVFTPVREDWMALETHAGDAPRWPS